MPSGPTLDAISGPAPADAPEPHSLRDLPKELGVMMVTAGVIGVALPGPGVPALVAGGLILWPERLGKLEGWFRRRFPKAHSDSLQQVHRYLADLERRYPGSMRSSRDADRSLPDRTESRLIPEAHDHGDEREVRRGRQHPDERIGDAPIRDGTR